MDGKYGDGVEVVEFWLATETPMRRLTVYVWMWRREMILRACQNEESYKQNFVRCLLETV